MCISTSWCDKDLPGNYFDTSLPTNYVGFIHVQLFSRSINTKAETVKFFEKKSSTISIQPLIVIQKILLWIKNVILEILKHSMLSYILKYSHLSPETML